MIDMVSYGLTPLLKHGWQYDAFGMPLRFRWRDLEQAADIVNYLGVMHSEEWFNFVQDNLGNANKIANVVLNRDADAD